MRAIILFFLFIQIAMAAPEPLGLPWGSKVNPDFRELEGYRYEMGAPSWGRMYFEGIVDAPLESELLVLFSGRRLTEAYLTFGPIGITEANCVSRYREVVRTLNAKYGKSTGVRIYRDSLMRDLIFASECYAVSVGVYEIETRWSFGNFEIAASVFSDDRDLLIEVRYVYVPFKGVKSYLFKYL
jgi:hypothetical protein